MSEASRRGSAPRAIRLKPESRQYAMEILLVERDHLVRDQVKVGLQQFQEFVVRWGEGYSAINEVRQRSYDCAFIGIDGRKGEGLRLLEHLRSFDRTIEVVVLTSARTARDLAKEKTRLNIHSFIHTPLDAKEFFRFMGRFRERLQEVTESGSVILTPK